MKAKEYGARPPHNDFKSGKRYSANGYNNSFKKERFPKAQEFANRNLEEYHRYDETVDLTKEQDDQQSNQSKKTDNAQKKRQKMLQQVVGILVGSTIIATSYQARVNEIANQQELESTVAVAETIDTPVETETEISDTAPQDSVENDKAPANDKNDSDQSKKNSGASKNNSSSSGKKSSSSGSRSGKNRGTSNSSGATNNNASTENNADPSDDENLQNDSQNRDDFSATQNDANATTADGNNTNSSEIGNSQNNNQNTEGSSGSENDANTTTTNENDTNLPETNNSQNDNTDTKTSSNETTQSTTASLRRRYSMTWEWNSDKTAVSYVVKTSTGNVISSTPATITTVEEPATCKKDGKITYTATVDVSGTTYTDIQYEDLPALGHSFGSGEEVTLEGGHKAIRFECTRCHEYFTIKASINEE